MSVSTLSEKRAAAQQVGAAAKRQKRELGVVVPISEFARVKETAYPAISIHCNIRPVEHLTPEQAVKWREFWAMVFDKAGNAHGD